MRHGLEYHVDNILGGGIRRQTFRVSRDDTKSALVLSASCLESSTQYLRIRIVNLGYTALHTYEFACFRRKCFADTTLTIFLYSPR